MDPGHHHDDFGPGPGPHRRVRPESLLLKRLTASHVAAWHLHSDCQCGFVRRSRSRAKAWADGAADRDYLSESIVTGTFSTSVWTNFYTKFLQAFGMG